ncbi:hypothetical protein [Nocardia sp. NPDC050406]|uniref:hypothetical protein n=1 Tax=Nocardia sp. NPDC050406 TaxID=3364318 RepID=UPI003787E7E7
MTATMPPELGTGSLFLRNALRVDGWSTAAFGVFMLALGPVLREPLGVPSHWSVPIGVAMLGGAAALLLIARLAVISARLAWGVVTANAVSVLAMVVLAVTDVMPLTGWGRAFLFLGAAAVAVFASFEYVGLRRTER